MEPEADRRPYFRDARFWIAAGLVLLLALVLRLFGLNKGLWLDEYQAVYEFAGNSGLRHTVQVLRRDIHAPLYFGMLAVWRRVGGDGEPYLRLLTVAISLAWMGVAMAWLKTYGRSAALLAGLITATAPFILRYGQEIKDYPLLVFFTVLAFYFTGSFLRDPRKKFDALFAGIALTAALCAHLIAIFLPAAVLAFSGTAQLAASFSEQRAKRGPPISQRLSELLPLAVAVLVLPLLTGFVLWRFYFFHNAAELMQWIPPASWSVALSLAHALMGFATPLGGWAAICEFLMITALLAGAFGDWRRSLPFLAAGAAYVAQVLLYSMFVRSAMVDRYFLPALVLLMAWFSVQLASVRNVLLRRLGISCVVLLAAVYGVQWVRAGASIPVESWRDLGPLITPQMDSSTEIFVQPHYALGILRHYVTGAPSERILAVPADRTTGEFLQKSMPARFSRAILVIRGPDGLSVSGVVALLRAVRLHLTRPGVVEAYFVSLTTSREGDLDPFLHAADVILGEPHQWLHQGTLRMARFELPIADR